MFSISLHRILKITPASLCSLALLVLLSSLSLLATNSSPCFAAEAPAKSSAATTEPLAVTHHVLTLAGGKKLPYTATAGRLQLKSDEGKPEAAIFFIAYTLDRASTDTVARPLTFAFNGGPGSAAMMLHMGALGPRRVDVGGDGTRFPASPRLVENEYSLLDLSDLVFIDPIGTGFSRAAEGTDERRFYESQEDIRSVGRFIQRYLTCNDRWLSPIYIVGESYGAYRAAGLAQHLQSELSIPTRGVILVSAALDFQTLTYRGSVIGANDLPYALCIPTFAAAAWYHKRLGVERPQSLEAAVAEAEKWAMSDYLLALTRGDALDPAERERVTQRLAGLTGLSPAVLRGNQMRISSTKFLDELLRDQQRVLGIYDARVSAPAVRDGLALDNPSAFLVGGSYYACFNDYVRRALGYRTELAYRSLAHEVTGSWRYGDGRIPSKAEALTQAIAANPHLKLMCAAGIFDVICPWRSQLYSIDHLGLEPALRKNVTFRTYSGGHMFYTSPEALQKFKEDVTKFYGE